MPSVPPVTLVTGAAGFVGGHLLDLIAGDEPHRASAASPVNDVSAASPVNDVSAANATTLVAWHRPGGRPPRDVRGAVWQAVELLDRAAVRDAIGRLRPALVYHCAGAAHVGRSW